MECWAATFKLDVEGSEPEAVQPNQGLGQPLSTTFATALWLGADRWIPHPCTRAWHVSMLLHVFVGPLIHMMLNDASWFVGEVFPWRLGLIVCFLAPLGVLSFNISAYKYLLIFVEFISNNALPLALVEIVASMIFSAWCPKTLSLNMPHIWQKS